MYTNQPTNKNISGGIGVRKKNKAQWGGAGGVGRKRGAICKEVREASSKMGVGLEWL